MITKTKKISLKDDENHMAAGELGTHPVNGHWGDLQRKAVKSSLLFYDGARQCGLNNSAIE